MPGCSRRSAAIVDSGLHDLVASGFDESEAKLLYGLYHAFPHRVERAALCAREGGRSRRVRR